MTFLLLVHLFFLINLQFTAWPEVVSFPYLFNSGFKLYGGMVHAYPPLLTIVLSFVYKIFGYKLIALKIFTWVGILLSDVLIFKIVKSYTKKETFAILAVSFYILTQPFLDGNQLWFDTALTLPILLTICYRKNMFLAGVFLTIALLTKQTAIVFIIAFYLYTKNYRFLIPVLFTLGLFLVWMLTTGQLVEFYNWNFYYPSTFWTKYPGYEILALTKKEIFSVFLVLTPAIFLFVKKRKPVVLFLFLSAALIAVYPRFSFYHLQPAIAIAAILFGVCLKYLNINYKYSIFYILIVSVLISFPVIKRDWGEETRFWNNEAIQLADNIKDKNYKRIYLFGPHSLIYVLSKTLPTTPWFDNYGWYFEIPGVQQSVLDSWKNYSPETILIQTPNQGQWYLIGTYLPKKIMDWINFNYNKLQEVEPGLWLWEKK